MDCDWKVVGEDNSNERIEWCRTCGCVRWLHIEAEIPGLGDEEGDSDDVEIIDKFFAPAHRGKPCEETMEQKVDED